VGMVSMLAGAGGWMVVSGGSPALDSTKLSCPRAGTRRVCGVRRLDVSRQTISRDFPEGFSGPFEPPIGLRLALPACMDLGSMVERVRGEFNEMPGLQLTEAQAARLWGLEPGACRRVVKELVDSEFLRWTPSGRITRAQR
jgi:hypothetical protein